jgi:hypothetical protein
LLVIKRAGKIHYVSSQIVIRTIVKQYLGSHHSALNGKVLRETGRPITPSVAALRGRNLLVTPSESPAAELDSFVVTTQLLLSWFTWLKVVNLLTGVISTRLMPSVTFYFSCLLQVVCDSTLGSVTRESDTPGSRIMLVKFCTTPEALEGMAEQVSYPKAYDASCCYLTHTY